MSKVRVGIIGVGNCASSLVQGVGYYAKARSDERVPGLMHVDLGGLLVSDVEFSCAFDVDADKVGRDLSDAIWVEPNNTTKFFEPPASGLEVLRGPTLDGLGKYYQEVVVESDRPPVDVAATLRASETDVLVNYLPVGSEEAARYYADQALAAGVAFVNCMPVFIATTDEWARRFEERRVPIIGDDIKSQVGATISHRVLSKLFEDRGVIIDHTYQLNFGGNMDFMNMLERKRLKSKKISKTQSVTSQISAGIDPEDIHIGPSDHVPWLKDRKWAYIRIEGREFGDVPIAMELKLEVWDSPNSAGVVIDAVRCAKLALDRGTGGPLLGPSAYFMKSPPVQYADTVARDLVEDFIAGDMASAQSGLARALGTSNGAAAGNGHASGPVTLGDSAPWQPQP
jgi:myo-inositol-1-phosphate synthase